MTSFNLHHHRKHQNTNDARKRRRKAKESRFITWKITSPLFFLRYCRTGTGLPSGRRWLGANWTLSGEEVTHDVGLTVETKGDRWTEVRGRHNCYDNLSAVTVVLAAISSKRWIAVVVLSVRRKKSVCKTWRATSIWPIPLLINLCFYFQLTVMIRIELY